MDQFGIARHEKRGIAMRTFSRILILTTVIMFLRFGTASARFFHAPTDDITIGAQLYDRWYAVLGKSAPEGNMPIWERQTTNTRSGPDTWRCSECHGWDYKGSEGAYHSGSHATGFPNVMKLAADMTDAEIVSHLKGSKDPSHDFSKYIDDLNLEKLAKFLKQGEIDDSIAVNPVTLKAVGGDAVHGKQLYETTCTSCHGADGKLIVFHTEGINEYIGSVANRDPYRFLHRTRFGVAGTEMPIGRELGWKPSDGVDVLAFAQGLPTGVEKEPIANVGAVSKSSPAMGGPQGGILGGIFTGFSVLFGMLGMSAFFLLGLVILGVLIVWALRKRN
jgi:mono/diheme cytochrome c family protein